MNIFVTDSDPCVSAQVLPDKHVVKMPVESCQIIALVYSEWYWNWGSIHRLNGTPYDTKKGAFRNHPCTQWAAHKNSNLAWLIEHGLALCDEYYLRYSKVHGCLFTLEQCKNTFCEITGHTPFEMKATDGFVRAMPDEWKKDMSIDTFVAYQRFIKSKIWPSHNFLRKPDRKPEWLFDN